MPRTISNYAFRRAFGETIDEVSSQKQPVTITKHGIPWVQLAHPRSSPGAQPEAAFKVRHQLSTFLDEVHYQSKTILICRRRVPVACLCPLEEENV